MSLQNRVAPDGSLNVRPERGAMMGNRGGCLHDDGRALGAARWKSRAWICCRLDFRGRHRAVWGDGYSELFFLDEATALAAGHRPCYECRRADARAFAAAWAAAQRLPAPPTAPEMDRTLHCERLAPSMPVPAGSLPAGAIFAAEAGFHLVTADGTRHWTFGGYLPAARVFAATEIVSALTPTATRAALAAGYVPCIHPSAAAPQCQRRNPASPAIHQC